MSLRYIYIYILQFSWLAVSLLLMFAFYYPTCSFQESWSASSAAKLSGKEWEPPHSPSVSSSLINSKLILKVVIMAGVAVFGNTILNDISKTTRYFNVHSVPMSMYNMNLEP